MVDQIIALILGVIAVVFPTWAILTDKKTYILTPKKKDQNNGYSEDRS